MKLFLIAVLFVGIAVARPDFTESEDDFENEFGILDSDPEEKAKEAENLKKAEDQINKNNKDFKDGKSTFEEKLYPESNLPKEEFEKEKEGATMPDDVRSAFVGDRIMGVYMPPESVRNDPVNAAKLEKFYAELDRSVAADSYDANALGLVTEARNQQSCGSCAAFAAVGLHETCMLKAGAPKAGLDLSEQYLVDCGYNGGSMNACNGAYPHAYPDWFKNDGGVSPHEVKYPYLDRNPKKSCSAASGVAKWNSGAKVSENVYDYDCNADKMKATVAARGAVAAALYASDSGFSNYKSGVFQGCSSTQINHAVVVVGYGTENGVDYWLVKNSWGKNWGASGMIKIRRGTNECGMEKFCAASTCTATGTADAAPVAPPPPPVPAALTCDISALFGSSSITGNYTLRVGTSSGLIVSKVKCTNSVCTPQHPGPSNACIYICGQTTC